MSMTLFGYKNSTNDLDSRITALEQGLTIPTPLTTKGDIFTRNSIGNTRLPVGADGQIVMGDSSTITGLRYVGVTGATGINVVSGSTGINVSVNSDVVTLNRTQTMLNKTLEAGKVTALSNQTYSAGYLPIGAKFDTGQLAVVTDVVTTEQSQTLNNKTLNFPIISTILNTGQLSLPVDVDDWLVGRNTTDTLTNKTITNPIMSSVRNANNLNRTVVLPSNGGSGAQFVTTLATQDLLNKNLNAELTTLYGNSGNNRRVRFDLFNVADNTDTSLIFESTGPRNISFPDQDGTLALTSQIPVNFVDLNTNQTVAGVKTFSNSPVFNGPTNQTFPTYIPVGIHNTNKDLQAITNMASTDTVQTLLNKTINLPLINNPTINNVLINTQPTGAGQRLVSTGTTSAVWAATAFGSLGNTTVNATATTFVATNTFSQSAGTWSLGLTDGSASSPSNGVLQINRTGTYVVSYNASALGGANVQFTCAIYRTGVIMAGSQALGHVHSGNGSDTVSNNFVASLTSGDQLTLRIANNSNTTAITFAWYNINVVQLA